MATKLYQPGDVGRLGGGSTGGGSPSQDRPPELTPGGTGKSQPGIGTPKAGTPYTEIKKDGTIIAQLTGGVSKETISSLKKGFIPLSPEESQRLQREQRTIKQQIEYMGVDPLGQGVTYTSKQEARKSIDRFKTGLGLSPKEQLQRAKQFGVPTLTAFEEEEQKKPVWLESQRQMSIAPRKAFMQYLKQTKKEQMAKYGSSTLFSFLPFYSEVAYKGVDILGTKLTSRVKDERQKAITKGALQFGSYFVPVAGQLRFITDAGAYGSGLGYEISKAPKTPKGILGATYSYGKSKPVESILLGAYGLFKGFKVASRAFEIGKTLSGKGIKTIKLTPFEEALIKPFSRQRATLLLKDVKGKKYILGETKSGQLISIGGDIKEGETSMKAVLRELAEETGLKGKDIIGLKKLGTYVTPEETFITYTAQLKKGAKLKPASDLLNIKKISPSKAKDLLGKPIMGQTPLYPTTRKGIRSYELGLINIAEKGGKGKLNILYTKTKGGEFFIGNQSRYNVPWKKGKIYSEWKGDLLLTHATPYGGKVRRFTPWNKKFEIKYREGARGEQGLYLSPPSYLKITKINVKSYERLSLKEIPFDIKLPRPNLKKGEITSESLLGKYTKVKGYKYKRVKQKGYVPLSYLELGADTSLGYKFKILPSLKKPTVYTSYAKAGGRIKATAKAKSGNESEFLAEVGTIFKTTGTAERRYVAGRRVYFQELKLINDKQLSQRVSKLQKEFSKKGISLSQKRKIAKELKSITGLEYGGYKELTLVDLSKQLTKTTKIKTSKKSNLLLESKRTKKDFGSLSFEYYKPKLKTKSISYYKKSKKDFISTPYYPSKERRKKDIYYPSKPYKKNKLFYPEKPYYKEKPPYYPETPYKTKDVYYPGTPYYGKEIFKKTPPTKKPPLVPLIIKPGLKRRKYKKLRKKKEKFFYIPSFTAGVFRITGKKPKKIFGGYTPGTRPILNSSKRKTSNLLQKSKKNIL